MLVDGENYFRAVRQAMRNARERIIMIGWDFDTRVKMYDTQQEPEGPLELGEYIDWLVHQNPRLEVYILQWNLGALKLLKRGRTLVKAAQWLAHPRVHVALDDAHPIGAAQHEKLIVVDQDTAFCGGIDITEDRWDTRAHRDEEERRNQPGDADTGPWHDLAAQMTGDVVKCLSEHAQERWKAATGTVPCAIGSATRALASRPEPIRPDQLAIHEVDIAIARTRGETEESEAVAEIEALFCDAIETAQRSIYIESQYFTSKTIACALAETLRAQRGPEIVLINPAKADGWLESRVMDSTRARIIEALRAIDHGHRLRVYHPVTEGGKDIYVHAKILIVDARSLRVGSANIANRSMGFDSECDVCLDAASTNHPQKTREYITDVLLDLLAEHLGADPNHLKALFDDQPSLFAIIDKLNGEGRGLRAYQTPDISAVHAWLSDNPILDPQAKDTDWPSIAIRED